MKNLKLSAAACFLANPSVEKFSVTTDGMCFTDDNVATSHSFKCGESAEQRKVVVISKDDVKDEMDGLANPVDEKIAKGNSKKNSA